MKKLFILLGLITSILGIILSFTQHQELSIIAVITAFTFGLVTLVISHKKNIKARHVQYIFLIVIVSLTVSIYRSFTDFI